MAGRQGYILFGASRITMRHAAGPPGADLGLTGAKAIQIT